MNKLHMKILYVCEIMWNLSPLENIAENWKDSFLDFELLTETLFKIMSIERIGMLIDEVK
jgi:hypothetical protein